jgi:hypothetical protein
LSILWIDAIYGSVQNSMTPREKPAPAQAGERGPPSVRQMGVGKMAQGGLYPHLERQGLLEPKAAGRGPS